MAKGKVSKNSRTSKKATVDYTKRVKPRKETILIEVTKEVREELELTGKAKFKEIIKYTKRFGKEYVLVSNI